MLEHKCMMKYKTLKISLLVMVGLAAMALGFLVKSQTVIDTSLGTDPRTFLSSQVGSSAANGDILQTDYLVTSFCLVRQK